MQQLFLVRYSLVFLLQVPLASSLSLFELIANLFYISGALGVQLCIVALQGVHLALEAGLFFTLNHAALLVLNHVTLGSRLQFLLFLVKIFLCLVKIPAKRVNLELFFFKCG